jgi:sensor histidine kinase YesM
MVMAEMKNIYQWFTPFLMGLLIIGLVWFITDPATFMYLPRNGGSTVLYTALTIVIFTYLMYVVYLVAIRFFTNKRNKIKIGIEYAIMLIFAIFWNTLSYLFITYFINHFEFSASEWIRTSGLSVSVSFIYYMVLRNNRVTEAYNRQTLQLEKTKSNQLETELKYLRAQYHPHFLFNALNTIYFQIDDKNVSAKDTVGLLSELLRYQLYNIDEKVNISEEINFIKSYIRFQQLRMTKRLAINANFDNALDKQKIYPLIYQPFLENVFKYVGGEYWITVQLMLYGGEIIFSIENSLPDHFQQTKKSNTGIGIENIKRRLALLYPERYSLNIKQEEKSFIVELIITLDSDED